MIRRLFSCCKKSKRNDHQKEVYVLQLEHNKYYVGESFMKNKRIRDHKNHMGSAWTKKHKVIQEMKPLTKPQETFWELYETLEMIHIYGIENVRGSLFTTPYNLKESEKIMAAQLYCELHNLCRKCGGNDHFITQCNREEPERWVTNFGGLLIPIEKRLCQDCGCNIQNLPYYHRYCQFCYINK